MEKFNAKDVIAEAEKEWGQQGGSSSNWFKFKEGKNQIRILTVLQPVAEHFKAGYCLGKEKCPICKEFGDEKKPTVKYLCWIYDYSVDEATKKEAGIKIAKFPYIVMKTLQNFQSEPDYAFETMPMPYDIVINAEKAGTKEVEYTMLAARKETPLPTGIIEKLAKEKTPVQIKDAMRNKRMKELGIVEDNGKQKVANTGIDYPEEEINPDDIPF